MLSYKQWKTLNESMGFNLGVVSTPSIFAGHRLSEMRPNVSSILSTPDDDMEMGMDGSGMDDPNMDGINPSVRGSGDLGDGDMDDDDEMGMGDDDLDMDNDEASPDDDSNFGDINVSLDDTEGDDDFDDGNHQAPPHKEVNFMTKNGPVKFMNKGVRKMQRKFMSKDGKKKMDGDCKPCGKMMDKEEMGVKEDNDFFASLKKQMYVPKKVISSNLEEDYLLAPPEAPVEEEPEVGQIGFSPSQIIGIQGASGFSQDDIAGMAHLWPTEYDRI